jgi:hypothetical protein
MMAILSICQISGVSRKKKSGVAIAVDPSPGTDRSTTSSFENSIAQNQAKDKGQFSDWELPMRERGAVEELPMADDQERGTQRYSLDEEDEDGQTVRVPADRLNAWEQADHSAPLNRAEQQLKERLLQSILGRSE